MKRYVYGWWMWFWTIYKARTKRRGAGPMQWRYAVKMAGDVRYIVDGQHCRPQRIPRWRRGLFTVCLALILSGCGYDSRLGRECALLGCLGPASPPLTCTASQEIDQDRNGNYVCRAKRPESD